MLHTNNLSYVAILQNFQQIIRYKTEIIQKHDKKFKYDYINFFHVLFETGEEGNY